MGQKNIRNDVQKFPKLGKHKFIDLKHSETLSTINMKKSILKHNVAKLLTTKTKGKFLKAAKEKGLITYRKSRIRLNADSVLKIMEARRRY